MRKKLVLAGPVLAVAVAFGLFWFQPWKLVVDRTVREALPSVTSTPSTSAPADSVLRRGAFVSHEHATAGSAELVRLADGRHVLVLRDLDTSNGPDLRVWITDQAATVTDLDASRYVELGRLKGNKGSQVYDIPPGTDLDLYKSVTIWCKRFSASFGAADLT
ncbi:DM13 domain-containing protein [Longispora sp. K20-0274]|uniref:DM13 domain-containing protein n=1 Tax=Longispora sp. K20-0274 TaxID=3088255 RepID=UPI0039996A08